MDPQAQETIIRSHGHLVSHPPPRTTTRTPILPPPPTPTLVPGAIAAALDSPIDESGPPSPSSSVGPIVNFAEVVPGIYRSSYPMASNREHLQSLGLKTILCVLVRPFPFPSPSLFLAFPNRFFASLNRG